ncbi:hypothetical protein GmHk_13G037122 [Glycine max]|nr:hypothetical protein GmHk_13G037122 [Glycine max]
MSFLLSLSIPLEVNFHNKHINLHSATLSISATTSLVGTLSKGHLGHSILEFTLLKSFANHIVLFSSCIYREENFGTYALVNDVASSQARFTWWDFVPLFAKNAFLHN